ncbi:MAG: hypothetical protein MSG64_06765 [Pyrinomonadaceae bacterium MAG19_C2-C3]|nr:hypothetical protein [Pyrinomonadaceae bacterium MAG19_C2-C3]
MNNSYNPDPARPVVKSDDEQPSITIQEPEARETVSHTETAKARDDDFSDAPPMSLQRVSPVDEQTEAAFDHEAERHQPSVRDTLTRIPEALGALGHNLRGTFERAINSRDDYVVAVKVSPEAQHKLEQLVAAGVFHSRAEAASYLIDEGIQAQAPLFERVTQKLTEIEKLQNELRGMVDNTPRT